MNTKAITKIATTVFMCACLTLSSACTATNQQPKELATGSCGPDATYSLSEDGTLTISGTGTIYPLPEGDTTWTSWDWDTPQEPVVSPVTRIIVEEGITEIGSSKEQYSAFRQLVNLESVKLPRSMTHIGSYAFFECPRLSEVAFPDTLESIEEFAFWECESLKTAELPASLQSIKTQAFADCGLTSIDIPDGVTSIDSYAFTGCDQLEHVTFPSTLEHLGEGVFEGCRSLKSVRFPASITKFDDPVSVLWDCWSLREIVNDSSFDIPLDNVVGETTDDTAIQWSIEGEPTKIALAKKTAIGTPHEYKLSYDLNGGSAEGELPESYLFGEQVTLPAASKDGYEFVGWSTREEGGLDNPIEGRKWPDTDCTFHALFQKLSVNPTGNGSFEVRIESEPAAKLAVQYATSNDWNSKGFEDEDTGRFYSTLGKTKVIDKKVQTVELGKGKLKPGKTYYVRIGLFSRGEEGSLQYDWFYQTELTI